MNRNFGSSSMQIVHRSSFPTMANHDHCPYERSCPYVEAQAAVRYHIGDPGRVGLPARLDQEQAPQLLHMR